MEAHSKIEDLADQNVDVAAGMFYSNLVDYFIILVAATVFFGKGVEVQTVGDAAKSLRPLAAGLLFSLGIVVSGIMSIPVMTASTAYGLAELFGWAEGLDKRIWQARGFYILLAGASAVGAAIALLRISPVTLMYWSQVVTGFLLPPLFVALLLLSNDPRILGHHPNRIMSNLVGWGTVILTIGQLMRGH